MNMERHTLTFQGQDFKRGDVLVFNEKEICHALSFHFAEDMQTWAVDMGPHSPSCCMERIRFATQKEKTTFLRFSRLEEDHFQAVSVRYTAFF